MKKWLYRIIWIPVFVVAVLFLVANRHPVSISLDPFSAEAPALTTAALPLWFWLMLMLFFGFAAGAAGMWISGRPRRQKARAEHRELKALRKELAAAALAEKPPPLPVEPKTHAPPLETSLK